MIPQDAVRALAEALGFEGQVDPNDPAKLIAHAKDVLHNRATAWRHFEAEVRRRCKVQGRLKAARQERDVLREQVAVLGGWPPAGPDVEAWRLSVGLEWSVTWSAGRWVAKFQDCYVSTSRQHVGGVGVYGEGRTPAAAMTDYIPKITQRVLSHCPGFDAAKSRWISVPGFPGVVPACR